MENVFWEKIHRPRSGLLGKSLPESGWYPPPASAPETEHESQGLNVMKNLEEKAG
jgi:hypothetical protein